MTRRRPARPPRNSCRECGGDVYSWTEGPLCSRCAVALRANLGAGEGNRALRKRLYAGRRPSDT